MVTQEEKGWPVRLYAGWEDTRDLQLEPALNFGNKIGKQE